MDRIVSDTNSEDVAQYHFDRIARRCNAYASKILFNPKDPAWLSFVVSQMEFPPSPEYGFDLYGSTSVISPRKPGSEEEMSAISPETLQTLDDWVRSFRSLPNLALSHLSSTLNFTPKPKTGSAYCEVYLLVRNSSGKFRRPLVLSQWQYRSIRHSLTLPSSSLCFRLWIRCQLVKQPLGRASTHRLPSSESPNWSLRCKRPKP